MNLLGAAVEPPVRPKPADADAATAALMAAAANRVLFRALCRALRDQSASLSFRGAWPARPGLQGVAAATQMVVEIGEQEQLMLEWEDLLRRADVRDQRIGALLRPFFDATPNSMRAVIEEEYPSLAEKLGRGTDVDRGFAALRLCSQYGEVTEHIQQLELGAAEAPERKHRPADLLFACGDVCKHRFFGTCVVVGWDASCQQGESWVRLNRIRETLKFGTEQPFYNVLLEADAIPRYCSQENLQLLAEPPRFAHPHAPFFFRRGGSFVPSEALAFVYPDDHTVACGERCFRSLEEAHESSPPT